MTKSLRIGLLGCGMMGQEHIRNLHLTGAEVAVIAEPDEAMKSKAGELAPEASLVDSLEELLDSTRLDAIVIATPNYQHGDQLLQIFVASGLPIMVEKPLVTKIEQVARIRQAAAVHPAPVWVGMEYRFMPPMTNFRQQLEDGAIGELAMLSIREHRYPFLKKVNDWNRFNRNSGGTLVEKCCHFFDLMRLLVADEPIRVMASAGQNCNHLKEEYDGERPDILDNAFVIVDFSSGKRAMLDLSMFAQGSRYEQEVCAVGNRGKLECFIPGPIELWKDQWIPPRVVLSPRHTVGPVDVEIDIDPEILAAGSHTGATYYEHLGFQEAILGNSPVEVGIEDGLKAVVMGMAAQESARTGRAVEITDSGYDFDR
jgi:myo-inositol 2-dehydrogenase/D-chiro-inositol 1-dehydrogenase